MELVVELDRCPADTCIERGRHLLVACERGDLHAEIVAANLAFAFDASLVMFDGLAESGHAAWIEELYLLGEATDQQVRFEALAERARMHLRTIDFSRYGLVAFVTGGFPWGIATPETPTTHLRRYPDFGRSLVEGLWASQSPQRTSRTALLIDPGTVSGTEIAATNRALLRNGGLTRHLAGRDANVATVQNLIDLMPHDVIVLSSHAGDAPGARLTYEFTDGAGRPRKLVVDEAVGFGFDSREDKFRVTQYLRFHSIDGVPWSDDEAKAALPVGTAINDWINLTDGALGRRKYLTKEEPIPRVHGSMGIALSDGTWFFVSHAFAPGSSPLIVNNSCWSWHEISERATFAGARGYIGCLVPIIGPEAEGVAEGIFNQHLGKSLPRALWLAQNHVYGDSPRRPYVMVGLPCVSIQRNTANPISFTETAYLSGIEHWARVERLSPHPEVRENARRYRRFLVEDLKAFRRRLVAG